MRVLLIIPSLVYCQYLVYLLQKKGLYVQCAYNGLEGIRALKEESWDKVILGITLEFFNGMEVLEQFREFENQQKIKLSSPEIMIVSRIRNPGLIKNAGALGVPKYLFYPVETEKIIEYITKNNDR